MSKRIAVYTSCSINYLPKARALTKSLREHNANATIVLCLNEIYCSDDEPGLAEFDEVWSPTDLGYELPWIFKHNIMELNTAVKGAALVRLMDRYQADLYLYLDPDVYVYDSLDALCDVMGDSEIGLVPHLFAPETTTTGIILSELSVVAHGTYNLGHLLVRDGNESRKFAAWWAQRLGEYCYDEKARGLFTDQRWCDLVPSIFDKVKIVRQTNIDLASWNINGRTLEFSQGTTSPYKVDGKPLLTYHFSGTGPSGTHRRVRETLAPGSGVVAEIERQYEDEIARFGQRATEGRPFTGDFFDDGEPVTQAARVLYRNNSDLQYAFPNPFDASTYAKWLKIYRPAMSRGLVLEPQRIRSAFNALFDETYYLHRYSDAASEIASGEFVDGAEHYINKGAFLLYDPSKFFVSLYYCEKSGFSPSPARSKPGPAYRYTPLYHYLVTGLPLGIEPIEFFDSNFYLASNPDIEAAYLQGTIPVPLHHFMHTGDKEGRSPSLGFKGSDFLETHPEARELMEAQQIGVFEAYVRMGYVAGRFFFAADENYHARP